MTTPNHAGWTESNNAIATRSQRRRAVELAYEVYTKSALTEQEIDALEGAMEAAMTDPAHIATAPQFGPQEPPADYRIYNRRRPDGTFPPLAGFFDEAVRQADADTMTDVSDWQAQAEADHADWLDNNRTMEDARS